MNEVEFYREVQESDICPANFKKIYDEFKKYQYLALETLREFHRVCEKNKINYQLAYGSLLGAIRDNGQIPWDYDIDVFVSYFDKEILIKALEKDLNSNYYFYCPEVDKRCRHVIMRLAPKGYKTEVLHVDVFYYTAAPNDELARKKFAKLIRKVSEARFNKLINPREASAGNVKKWIKLWCKKNLAILKKTDKISKKYEELCGRYSPQDSNFFISADSFAEWYLFPKELFRDTKLIKIETGTFRIPVDYKKMLEITYGEFDRIPPLKQRLEEMLFAYDRLKYFDNH